MRPISKSVKAVYTALLRQKQERRVCKRCRSRTKVLRATGSGPTDASKATLLSGRDRGEDGRDDELKRGGRG